MDKNCIIGIGMGCNEFTYIFYPIEIGSLLILMLFMVNQE